MGARANAPAAPKEQVLQAEATMKYFCLSLHLLQGFPKKYVVTFQNLSHLSCIASFLSKTFPTHSLS